MNYGGLTGTRTRKSIPYLALIPCVVLYFIDFMGCVMGLSSVFMVSVPIGSGSSLRVGYFGVCLQGNASDENRCVPTADKPHETVAALLGLDNDQNSLTAIQFVLTFQKRVVVPYILPVASSLLLVAGASIGFWELKHRHNNVWRYAGMVLLSFSFTLAVAAALSTSEASGALALGSVTTGGPHIVQGSVLQGIEWAAVAIHGIISALFIVLTLSKPNESGKFEGDFLPPGEFGEQEVGVPPYPG